MGQKVRFAVYLKDQANVSMCNGRNLCRYANMNIYMPFVVLVWVNFLFAQPISMNAVRTSCGSGYFIDNESNQPAMVVRGFFCGNSYFYTPISFGDSIKELAFLDQSLFTGVAEDYDSSNHVIGRYRFSEGLLQDLEEFMPSGEPVLQLHFEHGKQHGEQRAYARNGVLEHMSTYAHGLLHGPFFYAWYGDFDQCMVKGYADHGSYTYEKGFEPCVESGDNNK